MVRKTIKEVIKACDLFAHSAAFRYGEQPQYQSLTGGICSLILYCAFAAFFMNKVLETFNKVSIDSKSTTLQQEDPSYYQVGTDSFMFAIGVTGVDLNQGDRWFDIYFEKRISDGSGKQKWTLELQKCTKQQWTKINKDMADLYDKIGLSAWLCPTEGTVIELQGKYSSSVFKYYKFGVKQCSPSNTTNRTCVPNSTLETFLNANEAFTFNFYFINTIINPTNKQFLSNYLDDLNYFPFTQTDGVSANFFLSSFEVTTDESIYPFEQFDSAKGGIATGPAQTINYKVRQNDYLKFYIRKSSLSLQVQRSFRKVDDTLSYIGGLFSAIVTVLFIMKKYNEISYEMEIAKNLYHYDRNVPLKSDDFNFLIFVGYLIYAFFETICIKLPWKRMEVYFRSLEQVRKQMDIRLVMKKVLYSERMAIAVFDEHKAKILHLQEPLTLKEAEEIRKDHRFYEKLEQKYFDYKKIRQQQLNSEIVGHEQKFDQGSKNKINLDQSNKQISLDEIIVKETGQKVNEKRKLNRAATLKESRKQLESYSRRRRQKKNTKLLLKQTYEKTLRKLQEERTKANAKNILNLFAGQQNQKQIELNCMIENMKQCVLILQQEAEAGDDVSARILQRFDPKLMRLFLLAEENPSNQLSDKRQEKMRKSELSKYTVNLFGENEQNSGNQ